MEPPCDLIERPSRRAALREATEATHLRMHALPPFRAIEERRLPLDGYARLLGALRRFHSALGAAAEEAGLSGFSSAPRRLALIEADLAALGAPAPPPEARLASGGRAFLLGALYVGEGSMLGGRVVARQLDYLFGNRAEGRRFFFGTREDGAAWRRIVAALEESGAEGTSLAETVEGAEAAFALFERCVERGA